LTAIQNATDVHRLQWHTDEEMLGLSAAINFAKKANIPSISHAYDIDHQDELLSTVVIVAPQEISSFIIGF
jgi:hypothetical protein